MNEDGGTGMLNMCVGGVMMAFSCIEKSVGDFSRSVGGGMGFGWSAMFYCVVL